MASFSNVCSMLRASSTLKMPLRLRWSESRCAPEPSASPRSRANARTYVPLLHAMRMDACGRPSAELSVMFILLDAFDSCEFVALSSLSLLPLLSYASLNSNSSNSEIVMREVRISSCAASSSVLPSLWSLRASSYARTPSTDFAENRGAT